ncbi:MAG: hypothetical protein JRH20_30335 [Deltaproteobacteria bacterium]|nr:hypothetical protein [Deltaproteobacteria bacterium]
MRAMMAGIYLAEVGRLLWRELSLLGLAAIAGVSLAGAGQALLALGVVGVNGLGAMLLLDRSRRRGALALTPRWPRLRAALRASERRIMEANLEPLADAAEDMLNTLAVAPEDLRQQLCSLRLLCARAISRSLELSRLAAWRRAHLAALDESRIDAQLVAKRQRLLTATDELVVNKLVEVVDALSTRRALCASHGAALARIEAEVEATEQALLAGAAHVRHLASSWRELSAAAGASEEGSAQEGSARSTRRLLRARVAELDLVLGELSEHLGVDNDGS